MKIRNVLPEDLDDVTELEKLCFNDKAATKEEFAYRIKTFPQSFFVAVQDDKIIGMINGCVSNQHYICDELFEAGGGHEPEGKTQMVFGLATNKDYQRQGIAAELMRQLIQEAKKQKRSDMSLTCREHLIHYYEKFGFSNRGVSKSVHGGVVWYDMLMHL